MKLLYQKIFLFSNMAAYLVLLSDTVSFISIILAILRTSIHIVTMGESNRKCMALLVVAMAQSPR